MKGPIQALITLCIALAALAGCQRTRGAAETPLPIAEARGRDVAHTLLVGEQRRTYLLHLPPAYDGQQALSAVLVIHGGGGNGANAAHMTGMSARADSAGFIAVYPEGTGRGPLLTWNAGNCCAYAAAHNSADIEFLRSLIETLKRDYHADPRRIFVTGMSNGGMMAHRAGCELADVLAGIAPVAGALNYAPCQPAAPLAVLIVHGTADRHVLYGGGAPEVQADPTPRVDASVADAVEFWRTHNQCGAGPGRDAAGGVIHETYGGCQGGGALALYTVVDGGHSWPGGVAGRAGADAPSGALAASDVIWSFFAAHPRP